MGKKEQKSAIFSIRPFEKLKKKIESQHAVPAPQTVPAKKEHPATEEELFTFAMSDVEEIVEFRELSCTQRRIPLDPGRKDPDSQALRTLDEIAHGETPIDLSGTQEYVEWANPDCRDDIIEKLHEGRFAVENFIDLHGCTVTEAEAEIETFLTDALRRGLRCVKIIHGRGLRSLKGPLIKETVVRRLSGHYRKSVIAYVTARQCDGGLGALYVLLKKTSNQNLWSR